MIWTRQNASLLLVSFLILFLEIALIRWISTEVRIFAYLQNLVLLTCFIGIGLGCYLSSRRIRLYLSLGMLTLTILLIILPLTIYFEGQTLHLFRNIPVFLASFEDTVIISQKTIKHLLLMQIVGVAATLVLFFCILITFVPLGQILGRIFDQHKNSIQAYSINVLASLLGIWAFNALSFIYTPPWVWWLMAITLMGILMFLHPDSRDTAAQKLFPSQWKNLIALALSLIATGYVIATSSIFPANRLKDGMTVWSPYQKLTLSPIRYSQIDPFATRSPVGYHLDVNNVNFMDLMNLSDPFLKISKDSYKDPYYLAQPSGDFNKFNFPFRIKNDVKSVLILGGGAGNDAAGAIRAGIKEIDVVEIDPGIHQLGVKYHPEQPYSQNGVRVYIDDARAFLKKSNKTYDLIFLGLLDAHGQSATMNSMRMDHYVYTQESFEEAKKLLKDDGVIIVHHWVQRLWIAKRIEDTMSKVFGFRSLSIAMEDRKDGRGPIMILSGRNEAVVKRTLQNLNKDMRQFIFSRFINYTQSTKLTTDDWPYLYLRSPKIPTMHLCLIGILSVLFFIGKRFVLEKGQRLDLHFFFLGAAFLLLEFQNINKTALLFGMTWIVNTMNISAILLLILMANLLVHRFRIKEVKVPYILLSLSLLINFLIPLSAYNVLDFWPKTILACFMLNLPILFAGIVFIISFSKARHKNFAFGSNFLGAVAGGLMECVSFMTGIRMLIVIAMVFYGLSYVFIKVSKE